MVDWKVIVVFIYLSSNCTLCTKVFRITHGDQIGQYGVFDVVNPGLYPYMVRIQRIREGSFDNGTEYKKIGLCGGAIIKLNLVLTAAHCVKNVEPNGVTVFAGIVNVAWAIFEKGSQMSKAKKIVIHGNPNPEIPYHHDIGLVFLKIILKETKFVKAIELPLATDYHEDVSVTVLGWGENENGVRSIWLQKTELVLKPLETCQMQTNDTLTEDMVCAIDDDLVSTVCHGDSGGPLVYNNRVIGVISFALKYDILPNNKTACSSTMPAVFGKVFNYKTWIDETIREDETSDETVL